jgi:hypothetical protein
MDLNSTAATIANWTDLGVTIPAQLKQAAELYEATAYMEGPYTGIDLSQITVKTLEQSVIALADSMAVAAQFAEAKHAVQTRLGQQLLHTAGEAVDDLLAALQPRFERAASRFTEAVKTLPEDLSATNLVRSGPACLQAYNDALEAQDELRTVDKFLASLVYLPRYGGTRQDNAIRVLKPSDRNELQKLVTVAGSNKPDKYADLSPLFVVAVRAGIPFVMHDPRQWSDLRSHIDNMKMERNPNVRFVNW